jgi:hypothetical protein
LFGGISRDSPLDTSLSHAKPFESTSNDAYLDAIWSANGGSVSRIGDAFVTYNVNSLVFQELMNGVHIYRPRFIRVKLILMAP